MTRLEKVRKLLDHYESNDDHGLSDSELAVFTSSFHFMNDAELDKQLEMLPDPEMLERAAYRKAHRAFQALSPDAKRLFATDVWHATEILDEDDEERARILKKFE